MRTSARIFALLALAIALAGLLAGCERTPDTIGGDTSTTSATTPDSGESTLAVSGLAVRLTKVVDGFDAPLYVTNAGDGSGRLFVIEQGGRIWVVKDGVKAKQPFLDVSGRISTGGERGLLGLAFSPDYENSGEYAVNFTDPRGDTVVELRTSKNQYEDADTSALRSVLLTVSQPYANHNGGCLQVGADGTLYVGMGDGGSGGDPQNRAQNPDSQLGKLLAVDGIGWSERDRTSRFLRTSGESWLIAQLGLRNPWRFSFDRATGDLYIGDVGQNEIEEIDAVASAEVTAGLNFGWNWYEGSKRYRTGNAPPASTFTFPIAEYTHREGESVTGGYVYRGKTYPIADGVYVYADFVSGRLWGLRWTPAGLAEKPQVLLETGLSVSSFGEGEDGELYLTDLAGGAVYRVEFVPK